MGQILELWKTRQFDKIEPKIFTTRTVQLATNASATNQAINVTLDFLWLYLSVGTDVGGTLDALEFSKLSLPNEGIELIVGKNSVYASQIAANFNNFQTQPPWLLELSRKEQFLFDIKNNGAQQTPSVSLHGYTLPTGTGRARVQPGAAVGRPPAA